MHGFAGHHGKAAGAQRRFRHPVHPGEHVAPDHHQLFFRGVIVRGNHAPGRSFEKESGCTFVWIAVLAGNFETRGFAVENEISTRERRDYTARRNLCLSPRCRAHGHEQDHQRRKAKKHFRRSSRNGIHFFLGGPPRETSELNSGRLRRQTIHVCAPGVSMSTCLIFFEASHARTLRLISIKRSSVPHAIQSKRSCSPDFASSAGNSLSNSSEMPPELKAPIQAN